MKAYKLTDQNGRTRNNTQWGPNVTHTITYTPIEKSLCSDEWIYFYRDPIIAILLNPIHANFNNPKLWKCKTSGEELHEALKSGCKTLTTLEELPLPHVTDIQRIAFAILCAKEVCKDNKWNIWADKWLLAEDRTHTAIYSATYDATYDAAYSSAYAAAYADNTAIYAANAAYTAAAYAAAYASATIDFIELAHKALTYE